MVCIIPFDPRIHEEEYIEMNIELLSWYRDQLLENYKVKTEEDIGQTIEEYVEENTHIFTSLRPPEGIILLIEVEGEIAGTGAIKKFRDSMGEIKRMYIRPKYRGKGYSKILIQKLLEVGGDYGWRSFILDTPKFAKAAQGLYRSFGFQVRGIYPESEVPAIWVPYWIYMEKK